MMFMRTLCVTTLFLTGLGLAYFYVEDDRPVITTRKQIKRKVTHERIKAARQAIDATEPRQCTWRELFREKKK